MTSRCQTHEVIFGAVTECHIDLPFMRTKDLI